MTPFSHSSSLLQYPPSHNLSCFCFSSDSLLPFLCSTVSPLTISPASASYLILYSHISALVQYPPSHSLSCFCFSSDSLLPILCSTVSPLSQPCSCFLSLYFSSQSSSKRSLLMDGCRIPCLLSL